MKTVFEFGSGRSTKAFLQAGLAVSSLEDSDYWMQKTIDMCSGSAGAASCFCAPSPLDPPRACRLALLILRLESPLCGRLYNFALKLL